MTVEPAFDGVVAMNRRFPLSSESCFSAPSWADELGHQGDDFGMARRHDSGRQQEMMVFFSIRSVYRQRAGGVGMGAIQPWRCRGRKRTRRLGAPLFIGRSLLEECRGWCERGVGGYRRREPRFQTRDDSFRKPRRCCRCSPGVTNDQLRGAIERGLCCGSFSGIVRANCAFSSV